MRLVADRQGGAAHRMGRRISASIAEPAASDGSRGATHWPFIRIDGGKDSLRTLLREGERCLRHEALSRLRAIVVEDEAGVSVSGRPLAHAAT